MPNWCFNKVTVSGDKDEVEKVVSFVKSEESDFDFNKVLPYMGDGRECTDGRQGEDNNFNDKDPVLGVNGYEWCWRNWGTKWTANEVETSFSGLDAEFSFLTAWSPPSPVILKLSSLFPSLTFYLDFDEEGNELFGEEEYRGGRLVSQTEIFPEVEEDEQETE